MPRANVRAGWVWIWLFFVTVGVGRAEPSVEQLTAELRQRDEIIRRLAANLEIARAESELFQEKWSEAQLRAQMLGVNPTDGAAAQAQRQLVDSVRSLYLVEAERKRLLEELKRVILAVESGKEVTAELQRAKELIAANDKSLLQELPDQAPKNGANLAGAQILDVNEKLRLVVLNVGMFHGARVGMPFVILRGDKVVAELRVVEVRRNICGALVEKIEQGVTLVAGEAARVTKS